MSKLNDWQASFVAPATEEFDEHLGQTERIANSNTTHQQGIICMKKPLNMIVKRS